MKELLVKGLDFYGLHELTSFLLKYEMSKISQFIRVTYLFSLETTPWRLGDR